jgi:hypothetical protein
MKITNKMLYIPPYISASWENIESIYMQETVLVITLKNGPSVEIPNLEGNLIQIIFENHAKFIEEKNLPKKGSIGFGIPLISDGNNFDPLASTMQHNPQQANMPLIPQDILKKIASISKIISDDAPFELLKPEDNCNCLHCQIARALQLANGISPENLDEEVKDDELKFRTWDIKEMGEKFYIITKPLDSNEQYSVYLGSPTGCTCGQNNCEHIKAVLKS